MQSFLPKIYFYIKEYNLTELSKLSNRINLIYRNYNEQININKILKLRDFCKKTNRKLFIANNIKLALNYKLDGVYIPSFNEKLNFNFTTNRPQKFNIIGSAHNIKEIIIKEKQGCDEIFISSIFQNQKSRNFLGVIKFNLLANKTSNKIIALGGINEKNFNNLKLVNAIGFASISWAKKNGLRKLRPLL